MSRREDKEIVDCTKLAYVRELSQCAQECADEPGCLLNCNRDAQREAGNDLTDCLDGARSDGRVPRPNCLACLTENVIEGDIFDIELCSTARQRPACTRNDFFAIDAVLARCFGCDEDHCDAAPQNALQCLRDFDNVLFNQSCYWCGLEAIENLGADTFADARARVTDSCDQAFLLQCSDSEVEAVDECVRDMCAGLGASDLRACTLTNCMRDAQLVSKACWRCATWIEGAVDAESLGTTCTVP